MRASAKQAKRARNKRKGRPLRRTRLLARAILAVAVLGAIWCGYVIWLTGSYHNPATPVKADTAIVLGAALWRDKPSPGLQERLDYALKLYGEGKFRKLIVSGGLDHNGSKLTEAEGMRNYLVSNGVPAGRILLENKARSTYENLLLSKTVMKKNGLKSAVVITHTYHAPRSLEIARFVGVPGAVVMATESKVLNMPFNRWREVLAFTKWKLDEQLLRLGLSTSSITG